MSQDILPEQRRALDYLIRKVTQASVEVLREQTRKAFESVEWSFANVPAHQRGTVPAEGKWSAHEILDHLVLSHGPAVSQLVLLCHISGALLRVSGVNGSSSFPVAVFENPIKLRDVRGPCGE